MLTKKYLALEVDTVVVASQDVLDDVKRLHANLLHVWLHQSLAWSHAQLHVIQNSADVHLGTESQVHDLADGSSDTANLDIADSLANQGIENLGDENLDEEDLGDEDLGTVDLDDEDLGTVNLDTADSHANQGTVNLGNVNSGAANLDVVPIQ